MISAAHSWQLSVRPPAGDLLLEIDHWILAPISRISKAKNLPRIKCCSSQPSLADAINLGLTKIADACPGSTVTQLSWLS